MEPTQSPVAFHENEISLKSLILKLQGWVKYLWKKRLAITLIGGLGAGVGLCYATLKKPVYVAELTFVLEDGRSNPLGAYAGIASQFIGVDFGGAAESGVFSGDNILEFLRSRLMVERTLLSSVTANGKQESLAELYINTNDLRDKWNKDPQLKNLKFPVTSDRQTFSLKQDSILYVLYNDIIKKNLTVSKPDKKLSFILVKCTTENELFSKNFTERLVKEATNFYIQTKIQRSKLTTDKLQQKADSIELLLNKRTYSVAAAQDVNLNPVRSMAGVNIELVARDKIVLQTMYSEVVKNLELSKMTLDQETPVIQIVDSPILPLKKEKIGWIKGGGLGGVLGTLLIIMGLVLTKAYKEIMKGD